MELTGNKKANRRLSVKTGSWNEENLVTNYEMDSEIEY